MKNIFRDFKFSPASLAAVMAMSLMAFTVYAQPSAAPTGGAVNATFDTIHSNTIGTFGTDVATGGNVYVQGYLENNKVGANQLTLNDSDGVKVTAGSANFDVETQIVNNMAGQAVNISDTDGILLNKIAVDGSSNIQNSVFGTPVTFNDIDGVKVLAGPLDVTNVIKNSTGGAVRVEDADGFEVTLPTAPVRFKVNSANGEISNPVVGEPVKTNDTDGLTVTGPIYNPSSYLSLGNPNWNPSDYTGSNYLNLSQPIGNYATKAITGAYTATNCTNDAGLASGGTCWYPLIIRDEEGIALTVNTGTKRQTNMFLGSGGNIDMDGYITNHGPDTSAPGSDDTIYSSCTSSGKTFVYNGAPASELCTKPVKIYKKGLDVEGSIINSDPAMPIMLSDRDGVLMSGNHDGILWIKPDGATGGTGAVSISNENGDIIAFNGADKVAIGNSAPAFPLDVTGTLHSDKATLGSSTAPSNTLDVKSSDVNTLRLHGPTGGVEAGSRLTFGDQNYAYIEENTDDHLNINAPAGINFTGGYGGGSSTNLTVTGNETVTSDETVNGNGTVNGNLTVGTHLKANTLGYWTTETSSTNTIGPGADYSAMVSCFPGVGYTATGCGIYTTNAAGGWTVGAGYNKIMLHTLGISPGSTTACQAYLTNTSASTLYFKVTATCFTPNS